MAQHPMPAHPSENEFPTYVLVVEDAVETQLMIQLRLQKEGYDVRVASTGEEALEIARLDGDVRKFVPPAVQDALQARLEGR